MCTIYHTTTYPAIRMHQICQFACIQSTFSKRERSHSATHKVPKRRRLAPSWDVVGDRPPHQLVHGQCDNSWVLILTLDRWLESSQVDVACSHAGSNVIKAVEHSRKLINVLPIVCHLLWVKPLFISILAYILSNEHKEHQYQAFEIVTRHIWACLFRCDTMYCEISQNLEGARSVFRIFPIALEFGRRFGTTAIEPPVKFQNDMIFITYD